VAPCRQSRDKFVFMHLIVSSLFFVTALFPAHVTGLVELIAEATSRGIFLVFVLVDTCAPLAPPSIATPAPPTGAKRADDSKRPSGCSIVDMKTFSWSTGKLIATPYLETSAHGFVSECLMFLVCTGFHSRITSSYETSKRCRKYLVMHYVNG